MRDRAALRVAIADPGFTPSGREATALLELLGEDEHARAATRALLRIPAAAAAAVTAGFDTLEGPARAGACELVVRLAREHDAALAPWLVARLRDADAGTRRRAATALGQLEDPQFEAPLLAAWSAAQSPSERRSIAAALGLRARVGHGALLVRSAGPLRTLLRARTFMQPSIVLPPVRAGAAGVEGAIVRALASDTAPHVLARWTTGPIRWRLQWHGAGHRRGATYRVAAAVAELVPALVNDAREAPWQVLVVVAGDRVAIELQPRLDDPRFAWRRGAVPASSHLTVAAALASVAGVAARDVVWTPSSAPARS
ncbi:MAG: HEAT repeat domain-containing protein [Nannocystaceae bacterium]